MHRAILEQPPGCVIISDYIASDTGPLTRASRERLCLDWRCLITYFHRSGLLALTSPFLLALHGSATAQLREVGDDSAGPFQAAHVDAELLAGCAGTGAWTLDGRPACLGIWSMNGACG